VAGEPTARASSTHSGRREARCRAVTNGPLERIAIMDAEPTLVPQLPTITAAELLAARVEALVEEIETIIPALETLHPSKAGHARAAHTVSRDFLSAMIAAVEQEPDWRQLGLFDAEEARKVLQFNDAFRPVAQRIVTLARRLNLTMATRKAKIAVGAMNTYMMAKRYARRRGNAAMRARLEKLRLLLGRKNGRSG
jgi:hypothetical protein